MNCEKIIYDTCIRLMVKKNRIIIKGSGDKKLYT